MLFLSADKTVVEFKIVGNVCERCVTVGACGHDHVARWCAKERHLNVAASRRHPNGLRNCSVANRHQLLLAYIYIYIYIYICFLYI